jgi:ribosome-binding factor A
MQRAFRLLAKCKRSSNALKLANAYRQANHNIIPKPEWPVKGNIGLNPKRIKMDSTRLKKVERLLQKELSVYFQQHSISYMGKLISVTAVRISPDLSIARIYISIFPTQEIEKVLELIVADTGKIKYELGRKIKDQLRKIPDFKFFIDDSLDHAAKISDLLK